MLEWAKRMTWKGVHPMVEISRKVYTKSMVLGYYKPIVLVGCIAVAVGRVPTQCG